MFAAYEVRPKAIPLNRHAPAWIDTLRRQGATTVFPDSEGPAIFGDERDSLPLATSPTLWGAPNPWRAKKGLDPREGRLLFARAHSALPGNRCLVPVTGIAVKVGGSVVGYRDPNRPLLTLAAKHLGLECDDAWVSGFAFLVMDLEATAEAPAGCAALVVAPEHHDDWMDGWRRDDDVNSCCAPLLLSRMVSAPWQRP